MIFRISLFSAFGVDFYREKKSPHTHEQIGQTKTRLLPLNWKYQISARIVMFLCSLQLSPGFLLPGSLPLSRTLSLSSLSHIYVGIERWYWTKGTHRRPNCMNEGTQDENKKKSEKN